jgi:hypothetical protein
MLDVFRKLDEVRPELDPFPYVVVEDILPEEVCDALIREMPPIEVLTHGVPPGSNQRFNFSYADALANSNISALWREVLAAGISQGLLDRILGLFGPAIRANYPDFEERFAPVAELKAVARSKKKLRRRDAVGMDAQIALNTPALSGGTSVRPPHLDRTDKLFVGLLYLRLPEDDSTGADLELLTPLDAQPVYGAQRMLARDRVRLVRTIRYRRNTLVLFLNTPHSLHGVTPRQATRHPRYFINLVGEMAEPLFEVETMVPAEQISTDSERTPWLRRIWRGLAGGDRGARIGS